VGSLSGSMSGMATQTRPSKRRVTAVQEADWAAMEERAPAALRVDFRATSAVRWVTLQPTAHNPREAPVEPLAAMEERVLAARRMGFRATNVVKWVTLRPTAHKQPGAPVEPLAAKRVLGVGRLGILPIIVHKLAVQDTKRKRFAELYLVHLLFFLA